MILQSSSVSTKRCKTGRPLNKCKRTEIIYFEGKCTTTFGFSFKNKKNIIYYGHLLPVNMVKISIFTKFIVLIWVTLKYGFYIVTVRRPSRLRMGENRGFYKSCLLFNSRKCEKQCIKA